ncbi:MAG: hypothetical protein RIE08_04790 [Acidimicrobiales bacterium]
MVVGERKLSEDLGPADWLAVVIGGVFAALLVVTPIAALIAGARGPFAYGFAAVLLLLGARSVIATVETARFRVTADDRVLRIRRRFRDEAILREDLLEVRGEASRDMFERRHLCVETRRSTIRIELTGAQKSKESAAGLVSAIRAWHQAGASGD